jgi:hypothetical protein
LHDSYFKALQTTDGGFILSGSVVDPFVTPWDIVMIKLDSLGNPIWTYSYGGNDDDIAYDIAHTSDGGFVITGITDSYGAGNQDTYILKTDSMGKVEWTQVYGGSTADHIFSICQTKDNGFVIAGFTGSFGAGSHDIYFIKTDSVGNSGCHDTTILLVEMPQTLQVGTAATLDSTINILYNFSADFVSNVPSIVNALCFTVGSVEHESNVKALAYPNPSNGFFHIEFDKTIINGTVELYDLYSKVLLSHQFANERTITIDASGLPAGIYPAKILAGNEIFYCKVVIW